MEKTIGGREARGGDHVLMSAHDASDARGPLHGFDLSAEEESLLRGPVPERALRWVAAAIGAGARVRASEALEGGTSSAVHGLSVQAGDGRVHELVLRRFVREDWLAEEPDVAAREAMALQLVADRDLPTPRLVAVDVDGGVVGVPAVLVKKVGGRVERGPPAAGGVFRPLGGPPPVNPPTPPP